jgi:manganese transport protein
MGATVLHRQNLHPKGIGMIDSLSQMYVPMFGAWTRYLFLIGVWVVLCKTLYVSSTANSRMTADFLSLAKFVHYPDADACAVWIRRCCIMYPMGALLLYLVVGEPRAMVVFGGLFSRNYSTGDCRKAHGLCRDQASAGSHCQ